MTPAGVRRRGSGSAPQLDDDDDDGYGNICDAKVPGTVGASVGGMDLAQVRASSGKSRDQLDCGSAASLPCADLDEGARRAINSLDLGRPRGRDAAELRAVATHRQV